jgi:UDP-N-acetylmuramoyl-L-alanyl-D-glutamate--2,6-diaminopimelate ligase
MKLKKLFKDIDVDSIKGSKEVEITGLCGNSKLVAPGNLFIAKKGKTHDGNRYIPEAISAGAVAILTDLYDPTLKHITQVIHPNPALIEGALAAEYYQHPSNQLFLVGITGTNGKTTTAFLVKHLLDQLKQPCGLMGTIENIVGDHHYQATLTTADVVSNNKLLREMVLNGCTSAVMEVTSHALDQGRVANIEYDCAIFTNLTVDHLDYHKTMEAYSRAKNKLFVLLNPAISHKVHPTPKTAIVNADSPWFRQITEGCAAKLLTYAIENPADLKASQIKLTGTGSTFVATYQNQSQLFSIPLVGRFNVYNTLAAIGVGIVKGQSLPALAEIFKSFVAVPGRLEPVKNALGYKIFVDFAHTDDALINVLECLKEFKSGRIITVFGCGGDRDRSKRPKMAEAAEEHSDVCIVTSDNPRSEDPEAIAQEIKVGFKHPSRHLQELDRRKAIAKAVAMATVDDILLIAGKGHEKTQIFAHKTIEFDDRKVAAEECQAHSHTKGSR